MNTELSWKSGLFSTTIDIYRNERKIGFIKVPFFSNTAKAEIDGKKIEFREFGSAFVPKADIFDVAKNEMIGGIKDEPEKPVAYIKLNDEISTFTVKSSVKWTIHNESEQNIFYNGVFPGIRGKIEMNNYNPIQLLSGFYIAQIYSRITAIIFYSVALLAGFFLLPRAYLAIKGLLWNFFF